MLCGLPKNKELWSYVVKFDFSRLKSSSNAVVTCGFSACCFTLVISRAGADESYRFLVDWFLAAI